MRLCPGDAAASSPREPRPSAMGLQGLAGPSANPQRQTEMREDWQQQRGVAVWEMVTKYVEARY